MPPHKKRLCSENQIIKRSLMDLIKHSPETRLCPSVIKKITDTFGEWSALNSKFGRDEPLARKVLYYLTEIMYRSRFEDSSYVELVLRFIYDMNKDMEGIMFPREFSLRGVEKDDFVQYFLEHAYRGKVLFDGYRLPCTFYYEYIPIDRSQNLSMLEEAAAYGHLSLLRQMLRFGAMLSHGKNYLKIRHSRSVPNYPLFSTICVILRLNSKLLPIKDVTGVDMYPESYVDLVSGCELLLKEFSMSSLDELHKHLHAELRYDLEKCPEKENIVDFIKKFSANVIDDFQNHFIMTLSLKHISRLVIRRELNRNWALPGGIYQLPLPEVLKVYLDV